MAGHSYNRPIVKYREKCYSTYIYGERNTQMNPFDLMKNAKELQEKIASIKEGMENEVVEGASGGGLVKIRMKASLELESIHLDPIAVDNRDIQMLQDLIRAAHNDAVVKLKETIQAKLGPLAAGLPF